MKDDNFSLVHQFVKLILLLHVSITSIIKRTFLSHNYKIKFKIHVERLIGSIQGYKTDCNYL